MYHRGLKRISSKWTFFYKRIFPLLWFGFLVLFMLPGVLASRRTHTTIVPFLVAPAMMAVFGYALWRRLVFDLLDEVWDDGDALIVRNAGTEERVMLKNIINVGFSTMINPPRVTLTLREPALLGKELTFSPPPRYVPFARSPIINELIERVDRARRDRRSDP